MSMKICLHFEQVLSWGIGQPFSSGDNSLVQRPIYREVRGGVNKNGESQNTFLQIMISTKNKDILEIATLIEVCLIIIPTRNNQGILPFNPYHGLRTDCLLAFLNHEVT